MRVVLYSNFLYFSNLWYTWGEKMIPRKWYQIIKKLNPNLNQDDIATIYRILEEYPIQKIDTEKWLSSFSKIELIRTNINEINTCKYDKIIYALEVKEIDKCKIRFTPPLVATSKNKLYFIIGDQNPDNPFYTSLINGLYCCLPIIYKLRKKENKLEFGFIFWSCKPRRSKHVIKKYTTNTGTITIEVWGKYINISGKVYGNKYNSIINKIKMELVRITEFSHKYACLYD